MNIAKGSESVGLAKRDNVLKCKKNELNLDLMTDTFVPDDSYDAHIYGIYHSTMPFEVYKVEFSDKVLVGVMSAKMSLFKENFEFAKNDTRERSIIEIDSVFDVPPKTQGIYIEIMKNFNWGDRYEEYFWINFKDIDIPNSLVAPNKISVCLKPQIYD